MEIRFPSDREIPGLRRLWKQIFEDTDAFLDLFFGTAFSKERSLCALDGDSVAAALYWLDCEYADEKIAYLYAVATDEAYRGRGLCRKLTEQAHRILKDRGYAGAILVPAEPGLFIMYGKLGYCTCAAVSQWTASAEEPMALTELTPEEYALRRREMLPAGGVIQEGVTLELLAGMGSFYVGEGVLLTAIRDGEKLWVPELLGDPSKSGAIVAALGAKTGSFRGPGQDIPFAMYCSFDDSPAPTYLGFALD